MTFQKKISDEQIIQAYREHGSVRGTADALGITRSSLKYRLKKLSEGGELGYKPVLPGFRVSQVTTDRDEAGNVIREFIQQKPERGDAFTMPAGQKLKGVSALVDEDGREIIKWIKTGEVDKTAAAWREALDEFKKDLPRAEPIVAPSSSNESLLAQYTLTDLHFGMLAWAEETKDADYDLQIAERLLTDWFTAAVAMAPNAHTAVFAQLGDLFHYDSMRSETPEHRHLLDADSRPQKMVRVVIRVVRRVINMLLAKHQHVRIIMAKANHDPYSSAWMRESLVALYEDEPRLSVDTSPAEYYAYPWGKTALFYHHGHRRQVKNVDTVFVGMFREIYGACKKAYGHVGHLHNDEAKDGNLMKVERHRTLAPSDSYAAGGGWLSERDAKVIIYHKEFGEVSRLILSPEMVQAA